MPHELRELGVARCVRLDEWLVHPAVLREQVGDAVEQREVGLGLEREVLRRVHRRLGAAWIDDNDFGIFFVAQHALPENRMRDAEV